MHLYIKLFGLYIFYVNVCELRFFFGCSILPTTKTHVSQILHENKNKIKSECISCVALGLRSVLHQLCVVHTRNFKSHGYMLAEKKRNSIWFTFQYLKLFQLLGKGAQLGGSKFVGPFFERKQVYIFTTFGKTDTYTHTHIHTAMNTSDLCKFYLNRLKRVHPLTRFHSSVTLFSYNIVNTVYIKRTTIASAGNELCTM